MIWRKSETIQTTVGDYICRCLEMRMSIPNINSDEAISTFIKGLHHHDALKTKLLYKRLDNCDDRRNDNRDRRNDNRDWR
jgi:hypothetical protein